MEITWQCPKCDSEMQIADAAAAVELRCRSCDYIKSPSPGAIVGNELHSCMICATDDLYIQKDFPHVLGLTIVIAGFVVGTVFWYYMMPLWTYAVLIASAIIDFILYKYVPDVTICYRCLSQYRGAGSNPAEKFAPFDLAIGERYRQERIRIEELRASGRTTETQDR